MFNAAYKHTKYFVDECGQRIAGTPEVLKASDYIVDYYKENGIKTETHEFQVPICKVKKSVFQAKIGGEWHDITHTPAMFGGQTFDGSLELEMVYVENGSPYNFETTDVKGKIVLICRDVYMVYPDITMYKRLYENGAAAVIYTTSDGHWDVPYVYANFETMNEEYTIPTVIIHYKKALELLKTGVKEFRIDIRYDVEMGDTRSTIGIIEGDGKKNENIIVCAHLDSAVSSTGATDDVAGVAIIMELAKYYQQKANNGERPSRTIRFIAWSGHECGLHGSKYFMMDNMDIIKNTKFVFNYDIVGNILNNYSIFGGACEEVEGRLNEIVSELGYEWPVTMAPMVVDTLNFASRQIPQITLMAGFYCGNHTKHDALDLLSPEGFKSPIRFSEAIVEWAS